MEEPWNPVFYEAQTGAGFVEEIAMDNRPFLFTIPFVERQSGKLFILS
jgi:hypothetical protein